MLSEAKWPIPQKGKICEQRVRELRLELLQELLEHAIKKISESGQHRFMLLLAAQLFYSLSFTRSDGRSMDKYCKISNIRRTKSPNLNVSRLVVQLSLPNPMKPGVKLRMKMQLEQRRQAMLRLHLSDQQFYCLLRCDLY